MVSPGALPFQRLRLLIEQLAEEADHARGWPPKVAERTGLSLSYVRKIHSGERTGVTVEILERVQRRMRLDRRFFYDETLANPHYREFRRSTSDLPDVAEPDGHPAVEEYIARQAAAGDPVSETHQLELRSIRSSQGPDSITIEVIEGLHRGLRARDAMRELRRPDLSKTLDEDAGERKLPPIKKRRR